jgi:flagellar hook-associated protein 3 FlgL
MRTEGISTLNMSMLLRSAMMSVQARLASAQVEVSTGRYFDIGLTLGSKVNSDIRWRGQLDELQHLIDGGKFAANRAELTQTALDSIAKIASSFMNTLTGARGSAGGQTVAKDAAQGSLDALTDLLNTTYDGQYLFGGVNSQSAPLACYDGSPAKAALDVAFLAAFGFAQTDPQVAGISGAAMAGFLGGPYHALFEPPGWQASWSQAADQGVKTRIGSELMTDVSVSANASGFRKLAEALTMVMDLGEGNLSQPAFEEVVDAALSLAGMAQLETGAEQTRIGLAQSQISAAIDRMTLQRTALTKNIQNLESADPYEAAMRVNELIGQLEASYTISGRLSQLRLANYI